MCFDVAAVALV